MPGLRATVNVRTEFSDTRHFSRKYFKSFPGSSDTLKADFQSSHEAPRSSLRVHARALSSNHNANMHHSQRGASCEDWKSAFIPS